MTTADVSRHRLRGYRNGRGLSLDEVGAQLGCAASVVGAWEAGTSDPPAAELAGLAQLLGVTPDAFASRHDDEMRDYLDAVVEQMPPLSDDDIRSAAAVLRRITHRRAQSRSVSA